jgi:ABC-type Fe3+/spermidine/putrescine transport system ATPase subunit
MTAADAHSLHVRNLVKRYGTVAAVDDVSFPLEVRRVGAGETTTRVKKALDLVQLAGYGDRQRSRFVADFLGKSNFIQGMVERVESEGFVHCAGGHRFGQIGGGARVGEHVLIAIRPEKIHLSTETPTAFANRIDGRVTDWSYFGAELHLRVKVEGIGEITATHPAGKSRIPLAAGAPVWLAWDPDDAVRVVED